MKLTPVNQSAAGRPAALFAVPSNPNRLLTSLLINGLVNQSKNRNSIDHLVLQILSDFHPQGSPAIRLNQAVDYLAALGIIVRWQTGPAGPEMILIREPLTGLIKDPDFTKGLVAALLLAIKEKAAG